RRRRGPAVLHGGRNEQRLDPLELIRVRDAVTSGVLVAKVTPRAHACPSSSPRHRPGVLSISSYFNPHLESPDMDADTIVVLEGDETGQELLEEALRVLAPDVTGLELSFDRYDLSRGNRPSPAHHA